MYTKCVCVFLYCSDCPKLSPSLSHLVITLQLCAPDDFCNYDWYQFFIAIEYCFLLSFHCSWNNLVPHHAPHPQWSDAADVTTTCLLLVPGRSEHPFQYIAKTCHYAMSERMLALSLLWCCCFTRLSNAIACLRNEQTGWTIYSYCTCMMKGTIRDSSSLLVQDLHNSHCHAVSSSLWSLSWGSCNFCITVSITISKNSMLVLGPGCFSWAWGSQIFTYRF